MTKNEIIKKSRNYNVQVNEILRHTNKEDKGWMVTYQNVLGFRTEEGQHFVDTVSSKKEAYVHGDDLDSVNQWLEQFSTLDDVRENSNRY